MRIAELASFAATLNELKENKAGWVDTYRFQIVSLVIIKQLLSFI
jgi:hypothetical protein